MGEEEFVTKKLGGVENKEQLKKILLAMIGEVKSAKYKTEIIKLCFILDYLYCKEFGANKGPTTVEYVKYNYGPYSESFVEVLDELKNEGKLTEVILNFGVGYSLTSTIGTEEVDTNIRKTIKGVVSSFGNKSLRELKAYIYNLNEFKKAEFGKPIILHE